MPRPRTIIAVVAATVTLNACGPRGPGEWHDEPGYRWRELRIPRGGRDGFTRLSPNKTGVTFANTVTNEQVLDNQHVLNGSGVAAGDVDGDGLTDLYFSRMHGPNVLYRNRGGWRFDDITEFAGVGAADRFSTGAVFADVDGDADVDLLVSSLGGPLSLFVNDGRGVFTELQEEAGLVPGFYGTTMTMADVDGDGDLDLYVANNKVKTIRDMYSPQTLAFDRVVEEENGTYRVRPPFQEHYRLVRQPNRIMRFEYAEPDKFYLNDGTGRFEELAFTSGRFLDENGQPLAETPRDWGLAARFYDVDDDGDPDLYVCNDFESPDHFWINDGSGGFRMIDRLALRTTSNANMAIDFADIDRDGDVDFLEVDMLDMSSGGQKTQTPADAPEETMVGEIETRPQLPRNTLHVNRGDATFAEAAYFAGLEASGWSWSVMFLDVDLDGYEDVLIGNGHARDFLDSDTKARIASFSMSDWRSTRTLYPELALENTAFRNNGNLTFRQMGEAWGFSLEPDISHGAATADLDDDGDLDVVINRLGAPAAVYRNESNRKRVSVRLRGIGANTQGIGAKIYVRGGPVSVQSREVTVGGMYVSSSDPISTFAAGDADRLTVLVRWRSGMWSVLSDVAANRQYEIAEASATDSASVDSALFPPRTALEPPLFEDVSAELSHEHVDADYNDFGRQPLLPNRLSQLGPGITWYDVDRDGDEDLVVTSGAEGRLGFYRNDRGVLTAVPLAMDAADLDLTAVIAVPNGAGGTGLLVGHMNYEAESPAAALEAASVLRVDMGSFGSRQRSLTPRVIDAIPGARSSTGPLATVDYDGDGDLDLFVGGRVLPAGYPVPASSRFFKNDRGTFSLDPLNSTTLADVGLVSGAVFSDLDGDGDSDLLLALEWGPLKLFTNDSGRFRDATDAWGLSPYLSQWNGVTTGDLNSDGLPDVIATSWGRNTVRKADPETPRRVYFSDFDRNGRLDVVLARYDARVGDLVPLAGRIPLTRGIPSIGRRVQSFAAYADATLEDVLGPALSGASMLEVTGFDHMVFLNRGERFEGRPLPAEAQLAPAFYAGVSDFNGDGHEDLFVSQNFFPTDPETQRFDAGRGLLLEGNGTGSLTPVPGQVSGIAVYGDQRGAAFSDYDRDGRVDLVVTQNRAATKLFRNRGATPGLRVRLVGPRDNPHAIGAQVRIMYSGSRGPLREVHGGAGYWSFNGPTQVMGLQETPVAVWVRWPGGAETEFPVQPHAREVTIQWRRPTAAADR